MHLFMHTSAPAHSDTHVRTYTLSGYSHSHMPLELLHPLPGGLAGQNYGQSGPEWAHTAPSKDVIQLGEWLLGPKDANHFVRVGI